MPDETIHPHAGMTDKQRKFLTDLCEQHDAPFNGTLTQQEARFVIAGLLRGSQPSRAEVREVFCPECEAIPGSMCLGKRGPRLANHQARVNNALRVAREKPFIGDE